MSQSLPTTAAASGAPLSSTPGARFRAALATERPLILPGAVNAVFAMQAQAAGFRAVYLSGSGVATASFGLPDLGMTTLTELCEDVRRISRAVPATPLIADADTGFGGELSIERSIKELVTAGAAGCHLEDQEGAKRCGHRPNKRIVSADEMAARVRAAAIGRQASLDPGFYIIARTDSYAQEGLEGAIARSQSYVAAGADAIFPEALTTLDEYKALCENVPVPILANITEFGKTPLFTAEELAGVGVRIVLYPLSIFRMLMATAREGYTALRRDGTQKAFVDRMLTRVDLYELINYHAFEQRQDAADKK